ncbi:MAG: hypothetical protein M3R24_27255 [Chloroflexota bacterium]|nr:hypothetical protein [Chloroflexota bacterium]
MTERSKNPNQDLERRIMEPVPARAPVTTQSSQSHSSSSSSTTEQAKQMAQQAGQKASQTAQQAGQKVSQAAHTAEQKASQAMHKAEQKAGPMIDQAKHQAASQKQHATQRLDGMAQAIRHASDELREQDQSTMAQYTDKAAQQIEQFAAHLRGKSVSELMSEAERYARRDPMIFVGSALLLGLLGARFLKSSSQQQHSSHSSSSSTHYTSGSMGQSGGQYTSGSKSQLGGQYTSGSMSQSGGHYQRDPYLTQTEQVPNYGPGTKSGPASNVPGQPGAEQWRGGR